ncbi:hypothetical protein IV203_009562 [Nitzschia inconspicua]|uniref:Uncharacterized protein n=1 Tax=Nitzschia inconspicua TaxID=303405 RepID=A0A9K3PJM6_9STRA|nr:hypothetical protein IV203_009562 [Nitzschia inconspicua]
MARSLSNNHNTVCGYGPTFAATTTPESPLKYVGMSTNGRLRHRCCSKDSLSSSVLCRRNESNLESTTESRFVEEESVTGNPSINIGESLPHNNNSNNHSMDVIIRRSSSFRRIKDTMEKLSRKALLRRHQFQPRIKSLLDDEQQRQQQQDSFDNNTKSHHHLVEEPDTMMTSLVDPAAMRIFHTDQQHDELLTVLLDNAIGGCAPTELQFQYQYHHQQQQQQSNHGSKLKTVEETTKSILCQDSLLSLSEEEVEEPVGFLTVLNKELKATIPHLPPHGQHDDLVLWLGDELEASTCGSPTTTTTTSTAIMDRLGGPLLLRFYEDSKASKNLIEYGHTTNNTTNNNSINRVHTNRPLTSPKEEGGGGMVEEMLESIELGYEASLMGCGGGGGNGMNRQ